jgi:hypothetical protein
MSDTPQLSGDGSVDFDRDAAWYRRFTSDAESNLRAFALRLYEAMPERVTIHESKPLFARAKTTGVSVDLDDHRYTLKIEAGRLQASIAMVVRGIALNTKSVDPAEWFMKLADETKKVSAQAKTLSRSLADFMAT